MSKQANYEYTDLFCGEANYSWVIRGAIDFRQASTRNIVRLVKKALNLTGVKGKTTDFGDMIEVRFSGSVIFITF